MPNWLPAVYPFRNFATSDGLISYGANPIEMFRQGASYVDRILKGAKPEDLPTQFPTMYELVINLKTAKSLDLTVPPKALARAGEVTVHTLAYFAETITAAEGDWLATHS